MSEPDILYKVIDNALLHLYMTITENPRFTPIKKRNEILVCYLKLLTKDEAYRSVRKELRNLLSLGKQSGCKLETKLIELHELSLSYDKNVSDTRRLFDTLNQIESLLGLPTQFSCLLKGEKPKTNTLYMIKEHIETGFTKSGKQIAPISIFLEPNKMACVLEFINTRECFQAEIQRMDNSTMQAHIVLNSKLIPE